MFTCKFNISYSIVLSLCVGCFEEQDRTAHLAIYLHGESPGNSERQAQGSEEHGSSLRN